MKGRKRRMRGGECIHPSCRCSSSVVMSQTDSYIAMLIIHHLFFFSLSSFFEPITLLPLQRYPRPRWNVFLCGTLCVFIPSPYFSPEGCVRWSFDVYYSSYSYYSYDNSPLLSSFFIHSSMYVPTYHILSVPYVPCAILQQK